MFSDMGTSLGREQGVDCECFNGLTQLRYCELSGRLISNKGSFESFISGLKFVETLDFKWLEDYPSLPDDIWNVKTLSHVKLWRYSSGPSSSTDIRNLQTLTGVKCQESWNAQLPKLPNVRNLDIKVQNSFSWDSIAKLLGTLKHLICLSLHGHGVPQEIVNMRRFPFYEHLQSLSLDERSLSPNKKLTDEVGVFPIHITELKIQDLQYEDDPLPVLEKLRSLRVLWFSGERGNRKMSCSTGGFPQLHELTFSDLTNLEEWEIKAGFMPILMIVRLYHCDNLGVPLGLQYLSNLKELEVIKCGELEKHEDEIRDICKHVPYISI